MHIKKKIFFKKSICVTLALGTLYFRILSLSLFDTDLFCSVSLHNIRRSGVLLICSVLDYSLSFFSWGSFTWFAIFSLKSISSLMNYIENLPVYLIMRTTRTSYCFSIYWQSFYVKQHIWSLSRGIEKNRHWTLGTPGCKGFYFYLKG